VPKVLQQQCRRIPDETTHAKTRMPNSRALSPHDKQGKRPPLYFALLQFKGRLLDIVRVITGLSGGISVAAEMHRNYNKTGALEVLQTLI
jgi:hypothetical protein